jgi:hypothetical protein
MKYFFAVVALIFTYYVFSELIQMKTWNDNNALWAIIFFSQYEIKTLKEKLENQ